MKFVSKIKTHYKVCAEAEADRNLLFVAPKDKQEAIKWVKNAVLWSGGGYHPDTSGKNYTGSDSKPSFTPSEVKKFEAAHEAVYDFLDPYEVCIPETEKLLKK